MEAAQKGDLDGVKRAFPEGCDTASVNRRDEDGRTALVCCLSAVDVHHRTEPAFRLHSTGLLQSNQEEIQNDILNVFCILLSVVRKCR